jgi:hypothetical protein
MAGQAEITDYQSRFTDHDLPLLRVLCGGCPARRGGSVTVSIRERKMTKCRHHIGATLLFVTDAGYSTRKRAISKSGEFLLPRPPHFPLKEFLMTPLHRVIASDTTGLDGMTP